MPSPSAPQQTDLDDALATRLAAQRARQRKRDNPDAASDASRSSRRLKNRGQRAMRFVHVYVSMAAFVVIGFFGVTGLLLNHPTWIGGDELVTTTVAGSLPESVRSGDGVEFLSVSEFLRSEHGVAGEVTNFDQVGNEASINYTGPAYGASFRFDAATLAYSGQITEEGFANAMRDLHTGSDTNVAWSWVIDISAGMLVLASLSGLAIQALMRKRRRPALTWMVAGATLVLVLGFLTLA